MRLWWDEDLRHHHIFDDCCDGRRFFLSAHPNVIHDGFFGCVELRDVFGLSAFERVIFDCRGVGGVFFSCTSLPHSLVLLGLGCGILDHNLRRPALPQ